MTKKKKITIGIVLLVLILSVVTFSIYQISSHVGTIKRAFSEPTNQRGTIGIKGSEGEYLTFKYSSDITEGSLEFSVIDSEGNIIGTFGEDIAEQKIMYTRDETYKIAALSESLVGKFTLKVYKN